MTKPAERLSPHEFVEAWKGRNLSERQAAHAHFIQLCRLLGVAAPVDNRALDNEYCFDALTTTAGSHAYEAVRRAETRKKAKAPSGAGLFGDDGAPARAEPASPTRALFTPDAVTAITSAKDGHGFADVWKQGCFCWEYKRQGKHPSLDAALAQLRLYAPSLANPPLLIVSDVDNFEIHTNFTGYPTKTYTFTLDDLASPGPEWATLHAISPLNLLRKAFDAGEIEAQFRPRKTLNAITEDFAARVADLANQLDPARTEDGDPVSRQEVAHFLMQLVFSLFAEDVGLLPLDRVTRLLDQGNRDPKGFTRKVRSLFKAMADGGDFGDETIEWFNGGLFRDVDKQKIPKLTGGQLGIFVTGEDKDWSAIEPSILGTLFERALDPSKRAQIGAHYTSRDDIMLIIEPVVLAPLKQEWQTVRETVAALAAKRDKIKAKPAWDQAQKSVKDSLVAFHKKLASVTILDPACGSGNFLYVAIQCLLDLEREVIAFGSRHDIGVRLTPKVSPTQLHGIEINVNAAELARISIWIGYLKWKHENHKFGDERPILQPLDTIECRDAILDRPLPEGGGKGVGSRKSRKTLVTPARWPATDFIIGNPPFLGTKMLRANLGDDYVEDLFRIYNDRIPGFSDLCCYWFELARAQIDKRPATRAGLLATQAIRNGEARTVLERIKKTGDIFMAWSDRKWMLDGAAVRVSMVGFDNGGQTTRLLNGNSVAQIHADLSSDVNLSGVSKIPENEAIGFVGDVKGGSFDIDLEHALIFLGSKAPNQQPLIEVVRPYTNGLDVIRRDRGIWVIDFGSDAPKEAAAKFGAPFDYIDRVVRPERERGRPTRPEWWLHMRPCPSMRAAIEPLLRYLATPTLTKHRAFVWMSGITLPDHQLIVFARSDDYFFGVLHSTIHELWALRQGTQLEDRPRYTPTSTFETFPLPWPPGKEPTEPNAKHHALWRAISDAAKELNDLREQWLNPPDWIAAVEKQVDIKYRDQLAAVPPDVRPLVRRSAVMAEACNDPKLKTRTLTNLYNERPAWLRLAHDKLDRAVLAAYQAVDPKGGWDPVWTSTYEPFGAGEITIREKGTTQTPADKPDTIARKREITAKREETDAKILGALLALNNLRA